MKDNEINNWRQKRKNNRIATLRKRVNLSPEVVDDNYLPLARSVQLKVTKEEFDTIVRLARQNASSNLSHYFVSLILPKNIEKTLDYVRRLLKRLPQVILSVAKHFKRAAKRFVGYFADQVNAQTLSMADVIDICERSVNKRSPERYAVGILRAGYKKW
jgi:hypothetical protein